MNNIAFASIRELAEGLRAKKFSSVELVQEFLGRIKKHDKALNSFITVTEEEALELAKNADLELARGRGDLLCGIPYGAKDMYNTRNILTTAASKILNNYLPVYDAAVIEKLNHQQAVLLGKNNLDQFAHGASTETSYFGPSHNPWDTGRIPGGSSGGSAVAVAAGLVPFSLGTDTGGSIRNPASLCGITGWKPTYGRVSRFGVISMTSSTDTMGALARSVEDIAIIAAAIAGYDPRDRTSGKNPVGNWARDIKKDIKGLRIGVPQEYFISGMEKQARKRVGEAIEQIRRLGAEVKEVSLPLTPYAQAVYAIITPSEISSNLSRYDGIRFGHVTPAAGNLYEIYTKTRGEGFGDEAKRRIMTGTFALSAGYRDQYYLKAQKVRMILTKEINEIFKTVDVLACPTSPNVAPKIGGAADNPLFGYIADQLNFPGSLAGLPALSIPCGFGKPADKQAVELPVGLQIIGPQWGEEQIFKVGHAYQQVTDFHKRIPKGYEPR